MGDLAEKLAALAEKFELDEIEPDATELDLEEKELEELPEVVCELEACEELFLDKVQPAHGHPEPSEPRQTGAVD